MSTPVKKSYVFREALTPQGWQKSVKVELDEQGVITSVSPSASLSSEDLLIDAAVCPGIPNLHSHSFQRVIAGRTATRIRGNHDHFWTWREAMYRSALLLSPEDVSAIAAQCFLEMLYNGFTSVAEFHYLHRDPQGKAYDRLSELSEAVIDAALMVGIPITHLPVLYRWSGFGQKPLLNEQRRFSLSLDEYAQIIDDLDQRYGNESRVLIGLAPHSLRAVSADELKLITAPNFCLNDHLKERVIHIHIAEQVAEVEMCLARTKQRPVQWLMNQHELSDKWCLVHATHLSHEEVLSLAQSQATVGLCPSTEADLGDGLFPLTEFLNEGGIFGIGSDSNVRADPAEELRLLEWGQRLHNQKRNLAFSKQVNGQINANDQESPIRALTDSLGQSLSLAAIQGGGHAVGRQTGFTVGAWADWFTVDCCDAGLNGAQGHYCSDQWVFARRNSRVKDVFIAGHQVITDGIHPLENQIYTRFTKTLNRLYR